MVRVRLVIVIFSVFLILLDAGFAIAGDVYCMLGSGYVMIPSVIYTFIEIICAFLDIWVNFKSIYMHFGFTLSIMLSIFF